MDQPSAPPRRDIDDPRVLRALAHPVRLRILEELLLGGSLTATELADRVGESPANCSWHLRQLSRYGFATEAGGGIGRQRPWRAVAQQNVWPTATEDAEFTLASDAAAQVVLAREYDKVRQWHSAAAVEPPNWRDAAFVSQALTWLTAAELSEIDDRITEVLAGYLHRLVDESARPPDARPVRFVAWGIPATPPAGTGRQAAAGTGKQAAARRQAAAGTEGSATALTTEEG